MEKLCERIYTLRKKAGMSQEELAHRTGVSRQTVSKWEKGLSAPSAELLGRLNNAVDVQKDYVMENPSASGSLTTPMAHRQTTKSTQTTQKQEETEEALVTSLTEV